MKINKEYIPALDGIRGIAILIVIASHYGFGNVIPGGYGVSLFFFISGFLITRLLIAEYKEKGKINLRLFYIRRVLRLYPALLFFVLLGTTYLLVFGFQYLHAGEIFSTVFYFRNYYPYLFDVVKAPKEYGVFGIVWSLAIEEHFYIIFPFLFLLFYKRIRFFILLTSALIVMALIWKLYIAYAHNWDMHALVSANQETLTDRMYNLTDTRFDSILYGCLMSLVLSLNISNKVLQFIGKRWVMALAFVCLLFTFLYPNEVFRETWRYSIQGICFCIFIPAILYDGRYKFILNIFNARWLIFVGKLSYSLYLFHWLGVCIAYHFISYNRLSISWIATAAPIGFILAYASYTYIEKPVMRLRKKYGSNVKVESEPVFSPIPVPVLKPTLGKKIV